MAVHLLGTSALAAEGNLYGQTTLNGDCSRRPLLLVASLHNFDGIS
ncbi:hypothetical protein DES53_106240 [Roseimicrobium gellanilyticum]|uniref:Uncharacterized protein n=1 Tax=Roseimicrobium gellanilyticum TaxID=748857 RepID=A0A366HIJ3_9BACT|nr:hypothetical protein DES53_106240 [Roseimicrobium gellanilyticum]